MDEKRTTLVKNSSLTELFGLYTRQLPKHALMCNLQGCYFKRVLMKNQNKTYVVTHLNEYEIVFMMVVGGKEHTKHVGVRLEAFEALGGLQDLLSILGLLQYAFSTKRNGDAENLSHALKARV